MIIIGQGSGRKFLDRKFQYFVTEFNQGWIDFNVPGVALDFGSDRKCLKNNVIGLEQQGRKFGFETKQKSLCTVFVYLYDG